MLEKAPLAKKNPNEPAEAAAPTKRLFVLTANDKATLEVQMKNLIVYLEQRPEMFQKDLMSNLAYTLGQRRSHLAYKIAVPATTSFEFIQTLSSGGATPAKESEPLRLGFIFTGQGAQWHAMGRELYEHYPVFTASLDAADKCLAALGSEWSLVEELSKDAKSSLVGLAHVSQPACTAVQLALVDLLRSWGIRPHAVAGHSSGEIAAAYAAGCVTFENCMAVAYHRGRLTPILKNRYPELRGTMMAVGCTKEEGQAMVDELQEKECRIACFNSPTSLTISGDEPAVAELEKAMEKKGLFNRRLVVDSAYHSHHMEMVAKDYIDAIQYLDQPTPTDVKFHSSLLGQFIEGDKLQASYWVDNLTCPVRFCEAVQSMVAPTELHKTGVNMLVELGPHAGLQGPIKQILKDLGGAAMKIPYASALIRKRDAVDTALELAGNLFTKGASLNFEAINFPNPGKTPMVLIDMPRYAWNHSQKYWHESRFTLKKKNRPAARNDILGSLAPYSNDFEPTWRNIVRTDDLPWLRHHKIQSLTLYPMAGFIAMAIEAAVQRAAAREIEFDTFELRDVSVHSPLMITDEDVEMNITLRASQEGTLVSSETWDEFRILSWGANKGWTEHCKGLIAVKSHESNDVDTARQALETETTLKSTIASINKASTIVVAKNTMYDALNDLGVAYSTLR